MTGYHIRNDFFPIQQKILIFLSTLFLILIVLANLLYRKFVIISLFGYYSLEISVGTIIYPFSFLISDLITEVYGKNRAMFCIKSSIYINFIIAGILWFANSLTATLWSTLDDMQFDTAFGHYKNTIIASMIAAFISQNLCVMIFLAVKKLTSGKMLWLRSNISTITAILIDNVAIVSIMKLFNLLPDVNMLSLIMDTLAFKAGILLITTPLLYVGSFVIRYLFNKDAA